MILCREILVSGLREYLAELRVTVQVTRLAKWKTFLQLLAVGFCIAGEAGDRILPITTEIGIGLLWFSAILTLYTGWDYFRAGVRHLIDGLSAMKLLYFAWVRERIGKPEEEIDPPASVRTVGGSRRMAVRARRGIRLRVRERERHPRRDRPQPREARDAIAGAREIAFFPPMTGG